MVTLELESFGRPLEIMEDMWRKMKIFIRMNNRFMFLANFEHSPILEET